VKRFSCFSQWHTVGIRCLWLGAQTADADCMSLAQQSTAKTFQNCFSVFFRLQWNCFISVYFIFYFNCADSL